MRKGISQIKIPIKKSDLTLEKISLYLDVVFNEFSKNAKQISHDYDIYCLDHAILGKTRINEDSNANNIVVIPSLKSFVDWKTGYVFGNPIKYAQIKTTETDDIFYLNKYVRNAKQRVVDKEVGKWAYSTGVGYSFIEPKSTSFNIDFEAPYNLYCKQSDTCAKIYSAFGDNEPLFDMLYTTYTELDNKKAKKTVKVLDVYTENFLYTFEKRIGTSWTLIGNPKSRGIAKPLPLTEKRFNSDGIGIIAMGESLQNSLDSLMSDSLDNVSDIVNEIYVYKNVNLGETPEEQASNHRQAKKNAAIVLNTPNGSTNEADVKTLSPKMSLGEIRETFSLLNSVFHSTLGVPMEVSDTNSGGTTKSGSEVANGYDNAYNRALDDINTFLKADTELLEKIMLICKNSEGNKIDNLNASEIEIKYSLNLTDNILTKTQSYVNLVQSGVPSTIALRICKLSNDPEAEGAQIDKNIEKLNLSKNLLNNQNNNSQE